MPEVEYRTFPIEHLREFSQQVFQYFDVPTEDAKLAADVLAVSDLRGIDSHGIARLHTYYGLMKIGKINPRPSFTIIRETPATATVDGDNGLGLVIGPKANELAMDKAEEVGTGWVAVRNTNHYGIAGYYPLQALERDQIGWSMTNTSCITAPLWGAERRLGTNPIAVGFPAGEEPPIVIDMATSACAYGKIEIAIRHGETIPEGWGIDRDGRVTTDPHRVVDGGALLPLGIDFDRGGHKGYSLCAMIDLLCGVLPGANWGPFTPAFAVFHPETTERVGKGIGHFFGAMQIGAFTDPGEYKSRVDEWIRTFRQTKPAIGQEAVLIPGDPERIAEEIRQTEGVPLVMPVVEDLRKISRETGIAIE